MTPANDDVTIETFEAEVAQTSDMMDIPRADRGIQEQQLEHQTSCRCSARPRGLFFALAVSVAVIVAGAAPLVEATPHERRSILLWTAVVRAVAGASTPPSERSGSRAVRLTDRQNRSDATRTGLWTGARSPQRLLPCRESARCDVRFLRSRDSSMLAPQASADLVPEIRGWGPGSTSSRWARRNASRDRSTSTATRAAGRQRATASAVVSAPSGASPRLSAGRMVPDRVRGREPGPVDGPYRSTCTNERKPSLRVLRQDEACGHGSGDDRHRGPGNLPLDRPVASGSQRGSRIERCFAAAEVGFTFESRPPSNEGPTTRSKSPCLAHGARAPGARPIARSSLLDVITSRRDGRCCHRRRAAKLDRRVLKGIVGEPPRRTSPHHISVTVKLDGWRCLQAAAPRLLQSDQTQAPGPDRTPPMTRVKACPPCAVRDRANPLFPLLARESLTNAGARAGDRRKEGSPARLRRAPAKIAFRIVRHLALSPLGWFSEQGSGAIKKVMHYRPEEMRQLIAHCPAGNDIGYYGDPCGYKLTCGWSTGKWMLVSITAIADRGQFSFRIAMRSATTHMANRLLQAEIKSSTCCMNWRVDGITVG